MEQTTKSDILSQERIVAQLCHQASSSSLEDTCQNLNERFTNPTSEESQKNLELTSVFKLKDPPDIEEILATDEILITPTSHNVGIINSACQQVLKQIEQHLLYMLKKNLKEQEIVQSYLNTNGKISCSDTNKKPNVKCAGMPYFKDLDGYPPPVNEDVLKKKRNNQLLPSDFINCSAVWNTCDAKYLMTIVNKELNSNQSIDSSSIDWMKISATDMGGKYSPTECKSKWMLNLRPEINKSKWKLKEINSLEKIAEKHNYQDWDKIAEELGTNRSSFQCCVQYQTHRPPNVGKWTKEENDTLKKLIEQYRKKDYIPWVKVTWHFEQRSLRQCQERYIYHLDNIKKGEFTMEEDFILAYLATKLKNFGQVAKYFPKRVSTQIRARYEYLVKLSMPKFSKEEDKLLIKLMLKYPKNWAKISEAFKNRSKLQCRSRWADLQKDIVLESDLISDSEFDENQKSFDFDDKDTNNMEITDKRDALIVSKNIKFLSKPKDSSKTFNSVSEEYAALLNYHKHCYKFLFGPKIKQISSEEYDKFDKKMKIIMSNLSVSSVAPLNSFNVNCLSQLCEFDSEDIAFINRIKKIESGQEKNQEIKLSSKIIPPNYMTLVGLRSLILAWSNIKNLSNFYKPMEPLNKNEKITSEDRLLCSDAKKLFKCRMKALFAFPLILSYISQVGIKAKSAYKPKVRKQVKSISKLRRREHAKLMSQAYRKKLQKDLNEKMLDAEYSDLVESYEDDNTEEKKETKNSTNKNVQLKSEQKKSEENANLNYNENRRKRGHLNETESESDKNVHVEVKKSKLTSSLDE